MTDPTPALPPDAPFETVFAELEAVVTRLEAGGLGLDEAMDLFARGMELSRRCANHLDAAQLRLIQLSDDDRPPSAIADSESAPLDEDEDEAPF